MYILTAKWIALLASLESSTFSGFRWGDHNMQILIRFTRRVHCAPLNKSILVQIFRVVALLIAKLMSMGASDVVYPSSSKRENVPTSSSQLQLRISFWV